MAICEFQWCATQPQIFKWKLTLKVMFETIFALKNVIFTVKFLCTSNKYGDHIFLATSCERKY